MVHAKCKNKTNESIQIMLCRLGKFFYYLINMSRVEYNFDLPLETVLVVKPQPYILVMVSLRAVTKKCLGYFSHVIE